MFSSKVPIAKLYAEWPSSNNHTVVWELQIIQFLVLNQKNLMLDFCIISLGSYQPLAQLLFKFNQLCLAQILARILHLGESVILALEHSYFEFMCVSVCMKLGVFKTTCAKHVVIHTLPFEFLPTPSHVCIALYVNTGT